MFAESIQSISSETDFGVDAVFADHAFVFIELSKGYVDKALGNDVCEAWFHGRVCYSKYRKKRDEFCFKEKTWFSGQVTVHWLYSNCRPIFHHIRAKKHSGTKCLILLGVFQKLSN